MSRFLLSIGLTVTLLLGGVVPRAHAQQHAVIAGTVTDSTTTAPVPQATVRVTDTFRGTVADTTGRFRLAVRPGHVTLEIQAIGYATMQRTVRIAARDTARVDVALAPSVYRLGTVTVEAERAEAPSSFRLSAASLKNAPALGEPGVIRTAAFLPGVTQPNDLRATINVRGGAGDQNQFLLDGIEVYNPNHLFGVLSPFNVQVLRGMTVHAAQFPARYGGRLSSVIAMQTRRPVDTTFARANLSLISASGVAAQRFGSTGVTVAARRTYADPVLAAAGTEFWYNFHDVNLRVTHDLGRGVAVEALGFLSRDAVSPRSTSTSSDPGVDLTWGGRMGALRLRHRAGAYRHRLTGSYVRSSVDATIREDSSAFIDNRFRTLALEYDGTWTRGRTQVRLGAEVEGEHVEQGWKAGADLQPEELFYKEAPLQYQAREARPLFSGYVSAERHLGARWTVQTGLRYSSAETPLDGSVAPRVRASYSATDRLTLTATTGHYLQFVAAGEEGKEQTIGEPTFLLNDPQQAWTTTLGATWEPASGVEVGAELYDRRFRRVARLTTPLERSYPAFERALGAARGIDVFARKTGGWLTGQLSYSYTRTRLTRSGATYPPDWSTPHTVQGLLGLWLGDYWQLRVAGTWRSGRPFTPAKGSFRAPVFAPDQLKERFIEGPRNSARLPAYARIDLSLRRTYEAQWFDWTLYVQALNVLNRSNPLRIDMRQLYTMQVEEANFTPGVESSLPVIPSVGVEFQF